MSHINNKRIAKNTLMLYGRTAFSLFISLLTSRVTLQLLGVENYGIRSAVAGVIAMFSVVSGSLSGSISRFITFELGHGDLDKLKRIFSTAINVQLAIGLLILLLGETVGVWFLNTHMNIPEGRMIAANWVLQSAIISFFIGLTQIPYTACIIGHEKMSVFAWFSIAESVFRLLIVYSLYFTPYDKLITLSVLSLMVSVFFRFAQRVYCSRKFSECYYSFVFDKNLVKEITGFAGWSFLTHTAWIFNTQGISILINIFFGVAFNAARGLASSMEAIIKKFCNDFTTAMKPQITKSYAAGEIQEMNKLICMGTRLSFCMMLVMSLPLIFEAHTVLHIWLGKVPDYTVSFFRLSMVASLITMLGHAGYTACMATGNIKWYTIIMTLVGFLVFPMTWIAFKYGAPVESAYYAFIIVYALLEIVRLFLMRHLWGFPIMLFVSDVIKPVTIVSVLSIIFPFILYNVLSDGVIKSVIVILVSLISGFLSVYYLGLRQRERQYVMKKLKPILSRINRLK